MTEEVVETLALEVGGIPILVRAESERHLSCATTRLGRRPTAVEPEFEMTVGSGDPTFGELWSTDEEQWVEGCGVEERNGLIRIRVDESVSAVVGPGRVELVGPVESEGDLRRMDDLTQFAVAVAVARPDRMLLHAAALGSGDDAVIVVGLSGRGKSTLAASALAGGWDLLGDDLAVVHPNARLVQAVQRPPLVTRDLADVLDLGGEAVDDDRDRVQLPPDVLHPEQRRLIGAIIVDHDPGPGRLDLIDGPDLGVLDAAIAVPPARAVMQRHLAASAALLNLPLATIHHAADPTARVRRSQELLAQAFEAFTAVVQ